MEEPSKRKTADDREEKPTERRQEPKQRRKGQSEPVTERSIALPSGGKREGEATDEANRESNKTKTIEGKTTEPSSHEKRGQEGEDPSDDKKEKDY